MTDSNTNPSLSDEPLNATLQRLESTLEQHNATAVTGLILPTFSGKAQEDVFEFLNKFKLATFALSDRNRCLAFNKCLVGTANIWAKSNIKKAILEGKWKPIKKALIERFGPADLTLKHREKLGQMKYHKQGDSTLIGFVERYVVQYKKAYKSHGDADAIIALRLNLPSTIIKSLNLLDDSWSTLDNCAELYKLIRRYESNILPFEETEENSNLILGKEGIKELLNQLREEFKSKQEPNQLLGAMNRGPSQSQSQDNLDKYRYKKRFDRQSPQNGFKREYQGDPKSSYNSNNDKLQRLAIQSAPNSNQFDNENPNRLDGNNYVRLNKPPSPCYYCKGNHWNRDCDRRNRNLN